MASFNEELIRNIKLFHSEDDDFSEEKYAFVQYVFSNIESISKDNIEICDEEFEGLNCNLDAYYYDEDSQVYNLYLAVYSDEIDDNAFLSKEQIQAQYDKIINFLKRVISGRYVDFDETSFTYSIADEIHEMLNQVELVVNIVSNYNIPLSYKKDDTEEIEGRRVSFRTYDLDDLKNKFGQITSTKSVLNCNESFGCDLVALNVTNTVDFTVYLFAMKGTWLAELYKNDSTRLLEPNVRSYLKRTSKVNAGILDTVKNNPEQFVSFNNGISAVATGLDFVKNEGQNKLVKIKEITNFQIVNGGQTTATLNECLKDKLGDKLNEVIVPVKLTVLKSIGSAETLIRNISVYSNTQTAIKKSDPPSNLPFYIQIKKLSQQCLSMDGDVNYLCYFERTNGEYETEFRRNNGSKKFSNTNPKNKKFDKIDLARAINCWEQVPYITCQGKEKNFSYFNDIVKNQIINPDEDYFRHAYAVIVLYRKLDKLAKKMKLSYKSNIVCHTLSLISYLFDKRVDLDSVWEKKDLYSALIDIATNLLPKVHAVISNPPAEHPEARMWARKEECWNEVKNITAALPIIQSEKKVEFFMKNEALAYISQTENFNNSLTWMMLLLWDNKFHILSKQQISMVKMMRSYGDNKTLTKKQVDFLKDIFITAVKRGYQYNK